MKKKYILTNETLNHDGHILHRIQSVSTFGNVAGGDLGGWVESEDNLSHDGLCWIADDAKVYDDANVCQNAKVGNKAIVFNQAKVYGDAWVGGEAIVFGGAKISGYAWVSGNARIIMQVSI